MADAKRGGTAKDSPGNAPSGQDYYNMIIVIAFAVASLVTWLTVASQSGHSRLTHDHDFAGIQKMHATAVPRVGGVGIVVGMVAAVLLGGSGEPGFAWWALVLLACAVPTFASGLTEDVTKRVAPRWRLAFTAISAVLAVWWLGAVITRVDVLVLDWLVIWPAEAVLLTIFVVTGVTNSVNLIDGFNGLASMCAMLTLAAIAFVAWRLGDSFVLQAALALIGATLGFFVFNYPRGRIFLGDGGAYFVGFVLVELSVLLMHRHAEVSAMFPLLACGYPIFETIFTMYRRRFVQRTATGLPDAMHLHHLFFRRQGRGGRELRSLVWRNSMTSPWLWAVCAGAVVPAVCFWDNTRALLAAIGLFMFGYVVLYRALSESAATRHSGIDAPRVDFPVARSSAGADE